MKRCTSQPKAAVEISSTENDEIKSRLNRFSFTIPFACSHKNHPLRYRPLNVNVDANCLVCMKNFITAFSSTVLLPDVEGFRCLDVYRELVRG